MHWVFNKKISIALNCIVTILFITSTMLLIRDHILFTRYSTKNEQKKLINFASKTQKKIEITNYSDILQNNPFGVKTNKAVSFHNMGEDMDQTSVNISEFTLSGTISDDDGAGFAVFRNSEGKQEIFKTGDFVYNLGKLEKVFPSKAVINGQQLFEIRLMDLNEAAALRPETKKRVRSGKRRSGYIRAASKNSYIIDKRKLHEAIENPQQLMTDSRLYPRYVKGEQKGYVLKEVKRGGIYDNLGLKNRDVLLKINDYDINDPELALKAFSALRGASKINLNILRRGKKMTLTYQIK